MFGVPSAWVGPASHHPQLHNLQSLPRILGISNAKTHLVPAGWAAQTNPVISNTPYTHLPPPLRLVISKIRLLRCPAADWGWGQQGQTIHGSARGAGEGRGSVPTHPAPPRVLPLLVGQVGHWHCAPTGHHSLHQPRSVRHSLKPAIGFSTYTINLNCAWGKLQSSVLQSVFHMSNIRYLAGSSEFSPEVSLPACIYYTQVLSSCTQVLWITP